MAQRYMVKIKLNPAISDEMVANIQSMLAGCGEACMKATHYIISSHWWEDMHIKGTKTVMLSENRVLTVTGTVETLEDRIVEFLEWLMLFAEINEYAPALAWIEEDEPTTIYGFGASNMKDTLEPELHKFKITDVPKPTTDGEMWQQAVETLKPVKGEMFWKAL